MNKPLWLANAAVLMMMATSAGGESPHPASTKPEPQPFVVAQDDQSQWPDWKKHANWCANVDNGSSHSAYLQTCHGGKNDQYDSVLACQRDAAKNNGDGGSAVRAIESAGRPQVNGFMANRHPTECDKD